MKKKFYRNKWFIIAVVLFFVLLIFKSVEKRRFYTSFYTNRTITIWKNYVIFEKYDGSLPPNDNFIKFKLKRDDKINVFFKKDKTVNIWSKSGKPLKTRFDNNNYEVNIYYGSDNFNQYCDQCKYTDSLTIVEYEFTDRRGGLQIMMNETATDTIRVSHYEINPFNKITRKHRMLFTNDDEHWPGRWDR